MMAATNEMATASGILTSTQPIQQLRIIKVVRVTNSDVINTQAARKKIISMNNNSNKFVHLPVKPSTRPSLTGRPLIGRRRLIRMGDGSTTGAGRRIIRQREENDASPVVVETAAMKPAAVKQEQERTKIIFVSNSKTARAVSTSSRPRRRNKKQQQQQKQEEQNNNNDDVIQQPPQPDVMMMTSQRREFDIENDKLTAAWHSLVNSVTKSSSATNMMTSQPLHDSDVIPNHLFEFSVQNRNDDVIVCKPRAHNSDNDVIMHPPLTPSTRPASGEKRSAVCSLTSSTSSSPNASDVDDDVIIADEVVDASEERRKSSEKSSSGFFKFRGRKILRKDGDHVTAVGNKLVTMPTTSSSNLIPHKPTTAKGEILPMKLRAFPSSFWEQPNDVTTYDVLPPVQPLFKNHTGDDVTNIRPVTPPNGRIINRRKKEIVKITDDSTNLLMRLFDSVEPKTNQRQTGIRTRRGRPRKTATISGATSTKQQQQHDDNPCIIESITEKLLYKLTLDHPHTLLSPLTTSDDVTNDDVYNNTITPSLRHNMMMSLPQLSNVSNEGFSLLLSEVAAVL